jgi:hypothetical protein
MPDQLERWLGREVVLDTAGSIIYLGRLRSATAEGYWLEDADVRDRAEGHATKERYLIEARLQGIRPNRREVFVLRTTVISISALADIIADEPMPTEWPLADSPHGRVRPPEDECNLPAD